jgi:hypothetical protein
MSSLPKLTTKATELEKEFTTSLKRIGAAYDKSCGKAGAVTTSGAAKMVGYIRQSSRSRYARKAA